MKGNVLFKRDLGECLGDLPDDRVAARQSEAEFKDIGTWVKNPSDHL
jgi:hypothetical protein